jgi:hypothetical protein
VNSPYPLFWQMAPFALILLMLCTPTAVRRWAVTRLKWLGLAIAVLLLLPYVFS